MRWFSFIALLVSFLYADANENNPEPFVGKEYSEQLITSIYQDENQLTITLDDGSCWKSYPVRAKRKQSWYEWWYEITPVEWELSDDFFFEPKDWVEASRVTIYAANRSFHDEATHIIENHETKEKLFVSFQMPISHRIPRVSFIEPYLKNPFSQVSKLESKVISKQDKLNNHIVLSDGSCWKIFPAQKKERYFWQEEIDSPDDCFIFKLNKWGANDDIQVFFIEADSSLFQKYRVKQRGGSNHFGRHFVIMNLTKNYVTFAEVSSVNFLLKEYASYAQKEHKRGMDEGYSQGFSSGVAYQKTEYEALINEQKRALDTLNARILDMESREPVALEREYQRGFEEGVYDERRRLKEAEQGEPGAPYEFELEGR